MRLYLEAVEQQHKYLCRFTIDRLGKREVVLCFQCHQLVHGPSARPRYTLYCSPLPFALLSLGAAYISLITVKSSLSDWRGVEDSVKALLIFIEQHIELNVKATLAPIETLPKVFIKSSDTSA